MTREAIIKYAITLYATGKFGRRRLAQFLRLPYEVLRYHTDKKQRERQIKYQLAWQKRNPKKSSEYSKRYWLKKKGRIKL